MASTLIEGVSPSGVLLEKAEERGYTNGTLERQSPATIHAVSQSDPVQVRIESEQTYEAGRHNKNDDGLLGSDKWLISVSSAVPEGKMISGEDCIGEMVDLSNDFVVYVSGGFRNSTIRRQLAYLPALAEPNRERTLVRTAEDFYCLHSDLAAVS